MLFKTSSGITNLYDMGGKLPWHGFDTFASEVLPTITVFTASAA